MKREQLTHVTTEAPDMFDLIDWAIEYRPELYAAIRFLHADNLYAALLTVWDSASTIRGHANRKARRSQQVTP